MNSPANPGPGYQVAPQDLATRVTELTGIGERMHGLVTSAGRLAERLPMLGTAPPAMHLAMRLREAAGRSGLTSEISAADTELAGFRSALDATVTGYVAVDDRTAEELRATGGDRP
ncbi:MULTISPECIES: hypothetical protein [Saccharopolyspora]|uniref:Excreted virulence factor EspC, type VII ESX diderm n=1 Tax=Saccharopolyspora cebuensis TaxID=418759 RepID=A0ABV4CMW3_9PSEU